MSIGPQFMRFCLVGGVAFVVDVVVLLALRELGWPLVAARTVSIWAAMSVAWFLNRRMTFKSDDPRRFHEYLRTMTANGIGAVTNLLVFTAALALWPDVGTIGAFMAGSLVALAVNFLGNRRFAFR
ncbi:GtrA family protein [Lutibaculum baratangense]|uniref:GtrA/DPMS transmembrane domain-containing protein n=1 Tax=Lutibaculum baratangense AMV1 TaxID=631454 RepID=V4TI77_9HYPH|nr:GtrA family protein [Lutibaculum baratangense]ESR25708.1 hypothetical protein N177_1541 [Lutibaculum baratangense AMV1]